MKQQIVEFARNNGLTVSEAKNCLKIVSEQDEGKDDQFLYTGRKGTNTQPENHFPDKT